MSVKLAPLVLFVFNRPEHTRKTVECLQKNELASKTNLFIFSDNARDSSNQYDVKKVREYIREITGFKSVTIDEKDKNMGLAASVISGVSQIIEKYGKVIVVEDDLISHPQFLSYMNESLNRYVDFQKVFSVTGFNYPANILKIPNNYKANTYFSYRAHSHSWGTWKDRWDKVDFEVKDFHTFKEDINSQKLFNRGGDDLTGMLLAQMDRKIDSWAIRFCYSQSKNNAYSLYPVNSLIRNIGFDGSGIHCVAPDVRYDVKIQNENYTFSFPDDVRVDEKIAVEFKKVFSTKIGGKIHRRIIMFLGAIIKRISK